MAADACIKLQVWRYAPESGEAGRFQNYEVATAEPLSVMVLLAKIHELDPGFACRTSTCFKGMCGSCLIRCNGKEVYGCTTLLQPGETAILEPSSRFRPIRDVVVDFAQPTSMAKEE